MQIHLRTAPPSPLPELIEGTVHLWQFGLDVPELDQPELAALLSTREAERATGIRSDLQRRRYIAAHGRLRQVLARYLGIAPETIEFGRHPRGKPFIVAAQNTGRVHFNASHTGAVGLVGVALGRSIGVDIEAHRDDVDMELIARRQFAPGERVRLMSLPQEQRPTAFFRCWTRKEAYLKAMGDGIAGGLQGFEVSFLADEAPALLRAKGGPEECRRWAVVPIDAGMEASAACVVEQPADQVFYWDLI